jgi:hypothetical protein
MTKLGTERHMLGEDAGASAYAGLLTEPIDGGVARRVEQLRARSSDFLTQALALH